MKHVFREPEIDLWEWYSIQVGSDLFQILDDSTECRMLVHSKCRTEFTSVDLPEMNESHELFAMIN